MGQLKQHTGDNTGAFNAYSKCAKLNAKYELALAAKIRMTEVIPQKEIPKVLKRMNRMAKQGKTIIVVSSEMPEILGITNRIGVMSNGHLSGIVNTKETDQEELLRLSAKYL